MTTRKYRKKPVVIEAYQTDKEMIIHTLEGDMKASVGDYIITGVNGEQYPASPIFLKKPMNLLVIYRNEAPYRVLFSYKKFKKARKSNGTRKENSRRGE